MVVSYHITDEQTLSQEWGKLTRISFQTTNEAGEQQEHRNELYNTGNGVAALLYNPQQKTVLLTAQFRIATVRNGNPSGVMTEVCAGKVDSGSAEETMRREIREETGCDVQTLRHVMTVFVSPGAYAERLDLYLAEYTQECNTGQGGGLKEEGEDITLREMPFEEAQAMIESGEICDAKTIILLQYAALKGIFTS